MRDRQVEVVRIDSNTSFGAWITQRRKALDLTRVELARCIGCSVSALRKIELEERRPSKQLAALLADCLCIVPDEQATFVQVTRGLLQVERLRDHLPASAPVFAQPAPLRPSSNLPAPCTPLIGREPELAALIGLLWDPQCRLLTLVGPGGIGKTRLAVEVARAERELFADGVFIVSLVGIDSPEFIVPAIAEAMGLPLSRTTDPCGQLINYLEGKHTLLLLDNMEQVLEGAQLLARVLAHAHGPKLLATSLERLDLQGEWVFEVQGLPIPPHDQAENLEQYGAAELFLKTARRAWTSFEPAAQERPYLVRICQLVDGMPLGIEMAAGWVQILSCREIAQEIEHSLDFLATSAYDMPPRHRSMRAVLDQSWQMLSTEERRVLRQLSVFRGGFSRDAAERAAEATLAMLAALVAKSLVRRGTEGRYDLHELVRQYAQERLAQAGELDTTCHKHMRYYLELAERLEPKLRGAEQLVWLDRLEKDHDNLRAALEWSLRLAGLGDQGSPVDSERSAQLSLRLVTALYLFWKRRDHWSEGREWISRALAQSADFSATRERAKAINAAVLMAAEQADTRSALKLAKENLELSRTLGDPHNLAHALASSGFLLWKHKDYAAAAAHCQDALALLRKMGERHGVADTLHHLGHIAINQGDYEAAQSNYEESIAIYRDVQDRIAHDDVLGDLGLLAYLREDYTRARAYLEESLARFRKAASLPGIEAALNRLGDLARCEGDYDQAERLYSESLTLYRDMGDKDEIPSLLHNLGYVAKHRGDNLKALALFKEALEIQQEMGNQAGIVECLAGIAAVWVDQSKVQEAARLFGAVEVSREAVGTTVWPANRAEYDRSIDLLRQLLDQASLTVAWEEGRAMSVEQAFSSISEGVAPGSTFA